MFFKANIPVCQIILDCQNKELILLRDIHDKFISKMNTKYNYINEK